MPNLINSLVNGAVNGVINDAVRSNPQMQQLVNVLNQAKRSGNPQAFVASMIRQNPQMAAQLNQLLTGQDAKTAAMTMAQNMGIDPNALQQMVNKY